MQTPAAKRAETRLEKLQKQIGAEEVAKKEATKKTAAMKAVADTPTPVTESPPMTDIIQEAKAHLEQRQKWLSSR